MTKLATQRALLQGGSAFRALALLGAGTALIVASPAQAQDAPADQQVVPPSADQPVTPVPAGTQTAEGEAQTGEDIVVTGSIFRTTARRRLAGDRRLTESLDQARHLDRAGGHPAARPPTTARR